MKNNNHNKLEQGYEFAGTRSRTSLGAAFAAIKKLLATGNCGD